MVPKPLGGVGGLRILLILPPCCTSNNSGTHKPLGSQGYLDEDITRRPLVPNNLMGYYVHILMKYGVGFSPKCER